MSTGVGDTGLEEEDLSRSLNKKNKAAVGLEVRRVVNS